MEGAHDRLKTFLQLGVHCIHIHLSNRGDHSCFELVIAWGFD